MGGEDPSVLSVPIRPSWVRRWLVAAAAAVVAISVSVEGAYHTGIAEVPMWVINAFTLDQERNLPTFFATGLLLLAAALLGSIAATVSRGDAGRNACDVRYWRVLGAGFAFLAFDEFVGFHERLAAPLRTALGADGWLYYAWIIPGAIVVVAVVISFIPFLRDLAPWARHRFLWAGGVYLSGVLGMEVLGGYYASRVSDFDLGYAALTTVEETLELAGLVLFIHALLLYLAHLAAPDAEPPGATS